MSNSLFENIFKEQSSQLENNKSEIFTHDEIDALGEIGNISNGTSATTLSTLLNQEVSINTPTVKYTTWDDLFNSFSMPCVATTVEYTTGLSGSNIFLLKENDAKIISDLMMGGEGNITDEPLNELHISAISEAMNQMIGSSSSSLSLMLNKTIDISPPNTFIFDIKHFDMDLSNKIVIVAFKMSVGNLINSIMMQILPIDFAKEMVNTLLNASSSSQEKKKMKLKNHL